MLNSTPLKCSQQGQKIVGTVYYPNGNGPFPLIIYAHGYGYNSDVLSIGPLLNQNIAYCHFDFRGGSPFSKSGGSSLAMSVLTEADDLSAVLDTVQKDPKINNKRIFFCGGSQGGYVSTVVATKRPNEIAGLFLISPAFVICDMKKIYLNGHNLTKPYRFMNLVISQKYIDAVEQYPIYANMHKYTGPVKIYHAEDDSLVPIKYAEKAATRFPDVSFKRYPNGGHMLFNYEDQIEEDIIQNVLKFK